MTPHDAGQLAFVFLIGFAWGVTLMQWLLERRERKRQERRERLARGEFTPWRVHDGPRVSADARDYARDMARVIKALDRLRSSQ